MNTNYWVDKWKKNELGFHQDKFEPNLIKHFSSLKPGIVFVPLCGKSKDMVWLVQQGWKVVGVEASPIACSAFFDENNFRFSKKVVGPFEVYEASHISLWCGDFFNFSPEHLKGINAIYDRAALIALPKETRKMYVQYLKSIFGDKLENILLVSLEYSQDKASGPPFSVESKEIHEIYGDSFTATEVERQEDKSLPEKNLRFKGLQVYQTVYWLKGKSLNKKE